VAPYNLSVPSQLQGTVPFYLDVLEPIMSTDDIAKLKLNSRTHNIRFLSASPGSRSVPGPHPGAYQQEPPSLLCKHMGNETQFL